MVLRKVKEQKIKKKKKCRTDVSIFRVTCYCYYFIIITSGVTRRTFRAGGEGDIVLSV
jgi:hypothetical protein